MQLEQLYEAVIFADEVATKEELQDTILSIDQQRPKPSRIIVSTIPTTKVKAWDIRKMLQGCGYPFKIDVIIEEDYKIGDAIDLSVSSVTSGFVLIARSGHRFDIDFVATIYSQLQSGKIVAIDYEDEDNFFIVKTMYNMEKYNLPSDIVKKYPEYSIK